MALRAGLLAIGLRPKLLAAGRCGAVACGALGSLRALAWLLGAA
jgi:hypothetical protein